MPRELLVRGLVPGDAEHVQAFVRALSPRSRRGRYFSPIAELAPRELERLTHARAERFALAAFDGDEIVGIAEYADEEFGVVVGDACQGTGLGRRLLDRVMAQARAGGAERIRGLVEADNRAMLRLARGLGFASARDADPALVRVERPLGTGKGTGKGDGEISLSPVPGFGL